MVSKLSNDAQARLDQDLNAHLRALGLANIAAYQEWCGRHGLSRKLYKSWAAQTRERNIVARAAQSRLAQHNRERKSGIDALEAICDRTWSGDSHSPPSLTRLNNFVATHRAPPSGRRLDCEELKRLLLHLRSQRAKLLVPAPVSAALGELAGNSFLESVFMIALHRRDWIRSLEDWKPRSHSGHRQLASLLRHFFVRYDDMPSFFDAAWLAVPSPLAQLRLEWYLQVGRGDSIRHCDLPLEYTKKMAHHFMHAPNDLTIDQALRWGQAIALGGNERFARAVIATRLGRQFEHEDFWKTVVQWFAVHPMLAPQEVGPIIDYLHHQRFMPNLTTPGEVGLPAQPNLSMKGRTASSLIRQVHVWHRHLARDNSQQVEQWNPSSITPFEFIEGAEKGPSMRIWTIRELLSQKALVAEGRQLHHCVASYSRLCASGYCSIWTMELQTAEGTSKLLTVEVLGRSRSIAQARGNCNRMPTEREKKILQRWASEAGLVLRV